MRPNSNNISPTGQKQTAVSVVICTHNPRTEYLEKSLDSLKKQTLSKDKWGLTVVDNRSADDLSKTFDLGWHPKGQLIREDTLGLSFARIRGIDESRADLVVFVDDDNVLGENYLEQSIQLAIDWPKIGCFGGRLEAEYEITPPKWFSRYAERLAIYDIVRPEWSNLYTTMATLPVGAGMVVRREVLNAYLTKVKKDVNAMELGRRGNELSSGEDIDLAYCALDIGLGTMRTPQLVLRHLMPASRLTVEYMERLIEGQTKSRTFLNYRRGNLPVLTVPSYSRQWLRMAAALAKPHGMTHLKLLLAEWRGIANARRHLGIPLRKEESGSVNVH